MKRLLKILGLCVALSVGNLSFGQGNCLSFCRTVYNAQVVVVNEKNEPIEDFDIKGISEMGNLNLFRSSLFAQQQEKDGIGVFRITDLKIDPDQPVAINWRLRAFYVSAPGYIPVQLPNVKFIFDNEQDESVALQPILYIRMMKQWRLDEEGDEVLEFKGRIEVFDTTYFDVKSKCAPAIQISKEVLHIELDDLVILPEDKDTIENIDKGKVVGGVLDRGSVGLEKEVVVYPNPFLDQVTIDLGFEPSSPCRVILFSIAGVKVKEFDLRKRSSHMTIHELPAGVYFISIFNEFSKPIHQEKVTKL